MASGLLAFPARTVASLRKHRNYRLYFAGQVVSLSGTWMQDTALPWLVVQRTDSPVAVGLLLFCRYVPFTLFGLFAGLLADRFDNRRLLMLTQAASLVVATALAVVTLAAGAPLVLLYVLAFLGGAATVFDAPSRHALTVQLVGRRELPNAVALNSSLFNAARVVGPAFAGLIIAAAGAGVCFAINAVSFLAVLAALALMRPAELYPVDRGERAPRGLAAIREGIAYVARDPRLRLIIVMTAVISLAGFNFRVLLPVLASKTLDVGAGAFGVLWACFGAGALAGALVAAGTRRPTWRLLLAGAAGFSSTMLLLAPVRAVWLAAGLLFAIGACFSLWTASSQTILQLTAPDRLRGRVLSLYLFVFAGLTPLGSLFAGWLASVGGTELAFLVAGTAGLTMSVLAFRRIWTLRAPPPPGTAVAEVVEPPL
jgi:MFS family permease